jgi:NAD(P)H-nitrite reductase large subunit
MMSGDSENKKICKCNHVYEEDIKEFVEETNSFKFDKLQEQTFCSTGCGLCKPEIIEYLNTLKGLEIQEK